MRMNDVRLIVTDMDGTFLGSQSEFLPENVEAFRRAAKAGISIGFASGRMPCMLSRFAKELHLEDCQIIGLNGAHVLDRPDGETLSMHPISPENREACLEALHKGGCVYNLYTNDSVYTNRSVSPEEQQAFRRNFASCQRVEMGPEAALKAKDQPCLKFFVRSGGDDQGFLWARQAISQLPGIALTSSGPSNFEIMPAGVDKSTAVRELAQRLHISMLQVMAFGDYDNDVTMLAACGHSVAMANATRAAIAAAVHHTRSNGEAGVAYAVDCLLNGQLEKLQGSHPALFSDETKKEKSSPKGLTAGE